MRRLQKARKNVLLGFLGLSMVFPFNVAKAEELAEFTLDPIVVTATRTVSRNMDIPAGATVITAIDLENKGAITLADAFRGVPGMSVSSRGGYGANGQAIAYIGGSKAVVVFIDGVRMNDVQGIASDEAGVDLNRFGIDPNMIDRMEVVRGGGSVLYGADAIGGVINIFTKKGSGTPVTNIGVAVGHDEQKMFRLGNSGSNKDFHWRINGTFFESDGYRENGFNRNKDFSLRVGHDVNNGGEVFFSYDLAEHKYGFPGPINAPTLNDNGTSTYHIFTTGYRKDDFSVQYYHKEKQYKGIEFTFFKHTETSDGLMYQDSAEAGENHLLTWGVDLRVASIKSTLYVPANEKHKRWTDAYFLQDTITIGRKWLITPAVRFERNNDFGDRWLPKVGAVYKAGKDLSFYANWGKVFISPNFDQMYTGFGMGNPNLRPETGWAMELGAKKILNDKHEVNISFFKRNLKDHIIYLPPTFQATNVVSYDAIGAVFGWTGKFGKHVTVNTNYTYVNIDASQQVYEAKNQFYIGVNYENKKFKQALSLESLSAIDNTPLGGHTVVNSVTQYQVAKNQRVYLNVYNLLDKKYAYYENYPANGISFLLGWDMKI